MITPIIYMKGSCKPEYFLNLSYDQIVKFKIIVLLPKIRREEVLFKNLLIGQERLMFLRLLCDSEFNNHLFHVMDWKEFEDHMGIKYAHMITLDNKEKSLEKKLRKLGIKDYIKLIHPKKLIQHGANHHPNYLEQIQLIRRYYK